MSSKKEEKLMVKKFLYLFIMPLLLVPGMAFTQTEQQPAQQESVPAQTQAVQQPKEEIVRGIIREIATDGSFIVVETTKILTTREFIDDSYLETDDNVEVAVKKTDKGLVAESCNYIFEDEAPSSDSEGSSLGQESPEGY